jgi:peptidoglycan hydrolase CwlO-like protein
MAENERFLPAALRRFLGVAASLVLVVGLSTIPHAGAEDIKHQLDQAKVELAQLQDQIKGERAQLDVLSAQAAVLAAKLDVAQSRWEQITEELRRTRAELDRARRHYLQLRDRLDERAREAYIQGPGNSVEFLLGATSLADLSDRLEFFDALSQNDADLANQVQNLKNDLSAQERAQEKLQADAAEALRKLQKARAVLEAKLGEQQRIVDDINAKIARVEELVKELGRKYEHYLASLASAQFHSGGIFHYCPVDQPRAVYDGFGAPRYAGGYHPHAGDDIVAPTGTQIRAPFDGVAHTSYNALGGNAVYVSGADGYVYNAHLSAYSSVSNGPVHAGDVIGYVGTTGDAQGGVPHDHFEWHPKVLPSSWPASPYGYSVIGSAVNPYPLLQQVC